MRLLLLGRVALGAQQPVVVKLFLDDLSVGRSVCLCVQCIMKKNCGSDLTAVCHHRSDASRDEGLGIGPQEGVLLGANLGRAIVTNGDFTANVQKY